MLVLVIDSCGPSCAVCVWQDGKILAQAQEAMERGQDARLMPMIVDTLQKSGVTFSDLDKIAVTRGPGSFTGARVGLAAAHGIGLASGKPVIGIDRFAIYRAIYATSDKNLLVVIESKRAELFCKFFPVSGAARDACLMTEDQIHEFMNAHPDTIIAGDKTASDDNVIIACAEIAARADANDPNFSAQPLYLRPPDVSFAAAKSR